MEKEEGEGWLTEEVKAVPTQWVKKASLSNIIAEELSDRQVSIKTASRYTVLMYYSCTVCIFSTMISSRG